MRHSGGEVDPLGTDLGTRPDEDVRVDHRVGTDPGPNVDVRRRHHDDAGLRDARRHGSRCRRARSGDRAPVGVDRGEGCPVAERERADVPLGAGVGSMKQARIAAFTSGGRASLRRRVVWPRGPDAAGLQVREHGRR